jgi:hypothetical protein
MYKSIERRKRKIRIVSTTLFWLDILKKNIRLTTRYDDVSKTLGGRLREDGKQAFDLTSIAEEQALFEVTLGLITIDVLDRRRGLAHKS